LTDRSALLSDSYCLTRSRSTRRQKKCVRLAIESPGSRDLPVVIDAGSDLQHPPRSTGNESVQISHQAILPNERASRVRRIAVGLADDNSPRIDGPRLDIRKARQCAEVRHHLSVRRPYEPVNRARVVAHIAGHLAERINRCRPAVLEARELAQVDEAGSARPKKGLSGRKVVAGSADDRPRIVHAVRSAVSESRHRSDILHHSARPHERVLKAATHQVAHYLPGSIDCPDRL